MSVHKMDTKGLNCPQPVLKLATKFIEFVPGDTVEIIGDCHTFETDIRNWCGRMKKTILEVVDEGNNAKKIVIQF